MISVIIPAYNVEQYIRKCLDSLISQTFSNFEVIVVDDGSTDGTGDILDEYAAKFDFIKVFHIENTGVSNARNLGITYSRGKYITFCDADDWYDCDVLEKVFETAEKYNCDLVVFGRRDIFSNSRSFSYHEHCEERLLNYSPGEYLKEIFALGKHTFSVCNKIYRREIIVRNNIFFDNDLKLSEDTLFNLKYISFIKSIAEDYRTSYNRLYRSDSAIYRKINGFYNSNIVAIDRFKEFITKNGDYKNFEDGLILMYYHYGKVAIFRNCEYIDGNNAVERIREISHILNHEDFIKSLKKLRIRQVNYREKMFIFLSKRKMAILLYLTFSILTKLGEIKRNLISGIRGCFNNEN